MIKVTHRLVLILWYVNQESWFVIIELLINCLFFFFSSRRRHTRCSRDWSSDVCSSDLGDAFHLFVGCEASCADGCVRLGHHLLKGGIGLNLIEAFFHIGINLNCFTDDQTAIACSIGSEFFKELVGVFVENKLTAHGWLLEAG